MYIIGKVIKPQGVRGEVKVKIITSFPEHFTRLKEVFLKTDDRWRPVRIDRVRISERFAYIKFPNVDSMTLAEELRDQYLYIPDEELQTLGKDEYYVHDLIGMDVFDEHGNRLGAIIDVESYKSNDVYVLETESGEQHLIPAVRDIVKNVDLSAKKISIRQVEGLME